MTEPSLSPQVNLRELFEAPDMSEWMKLTEKVLGGAPFEKKMVSKTLEGIAQQPIYDRSVLDTLPMADTTPGEFPFLRGTSPAQGPGSSWEVCQSLPYPTPEEFNTALLQDLMRGQDSVLLTLDENARAGREVTDSAGACGTCVQTVEELLAALKEVDVTAVPLHIAAGVSAPAVAAALVAGEKVPTSGSVCFDPVSILALEGSLPMSLEKTGALLADHVSGMAEHLPGVNSLGVDVSWNVNAGGNAVYDLALMLASAAESFRMLEANGGSVETAAENALVQFAIGSDFFMEISKFRAARALWAHLVKSCGGGETAQKLTQMAATSSWHQTRIDPWVNLLRGTSQSFSAVLGGVNGLRVDPFDAPFGLPDTFSRRIARNTQLVLRDEAHLLEVVDPAGGSWTVESLTQELAGRAWSLFQDIEKQGGVIAMLQSGDLQSQIAGLASQQKTLLAQRRMVKVGGNQFAYPEEKKVESRLPDTVATAAEAKTAMAALTASRDAEKVDAALQETATFRGRVNALSVGASLPEVIKSLSGEPVSVAPVKLSRLTDGYEKLRDAIDRYVEEEGTRPVAVFAQMGPVKQHKIRSDFSQEFLKPSGFALDASGIFEDPEAAARAAVERGAAVTVICSTDDTYPDLVPAFAKAVKAASPQTVVLMAGLLPDQTEAFRAAGVDDFIHLRANNLELLETLHRLTGVSA